MKELLALLFDFFIGLRKCYGFPSLWSFHDYLFKIKSFLGKFTAFLPVNKPWRSIKLCPILPFLVAKLYLGLPGSIILTRQVMIQGMDLTNPYRISSISADRHTAQSVVFGRPCWIRSARSFRSVFFLKTVFCFEILIFEEDFYQSLSAHE